MIIDREEKRVKLIKTDPDFTHKGEKGDTVPMHAGTARQKKTCCLCNSLFLWLLMHIAQTFLASIILSFMVLWLGYLIRRSHIAERNVSQFFLNINIYLDLCM